MLGDRSAETLEGLESAAAGPTAPALEQRLYLFGGRSGGVDGAQRLLDPPSPCHLERRAQQHAHSLGLLDRPVG